jgi:hypothetical protein
MVEGGCRSRLRPEPPKPLRVVGEVHRQQLQRDRSIELSVVRLVDLAHSAGADERDQLVSGDLLALEEERHQGVIGEGCWRLEKGTRELVGGEELLDSILKRHIAGARQGDKRSAVGNRECPRSFEHLLDTRPLAGMTRHGVRHSLVSQSRADSSAHWWFRRPVRRLVARTVSQTLLQ